VATTAEYLARAHAVLRKMEGNTFNIFTLRKPKNVEEAQAIAKVISKLSPFTANVLEAELILLLNEREKWPKGAKWVRQDPDFPDALLTGVEDPAPGIELKMWFPLATEITARFRETQKHLMEHQTSIAMIAWLPQYILYGQPQIIGIWIDDALTVAQARDTHYHKPPAYLVAEPEDTSTRTRNLQQRNCNGMGFQGTAQQLAEAEKLVASWGKGFKTYAVSEEFDERVRSLLRQFRYRLDTNFAKMDRIEHTGLEEFKTKIMNTKVHGKTIQEWSTITESAGADKILAIMELGT
jgi:hypothetical protein